MGRRTGATFAAGAMLVTLLGACRPDTVVVSFRPAAGATYSYRVQVVADTVTTVEGLPDRRTHSTFVLRAEHRVVSVDAKGVSVEVILTTAQARGDDEEIPTQTLVVRLDRAGQLTRVERVEGVPAERLGQVGLAAVFPAAAGAPPDRALSPGDRWRIDEAVKLGDAGAARLKGRGRLASLAVVDGHDVATIESHYELPVAGLGEPGSGGGVLEGSQSTVSTTTRALADGAIESASSKTIAEFAVKIDPPSGQAGASLSGTVSVNVRTKTKRLHS